MESFFTLNTLVQVVYFVVAVLFILGLKKMSSPVTARGGIVWAGIGMVVASLFAFLEPGVLDHTNNVMLIILAIASGSAVAYITAKRVQMTDMPQMIAIYNGMGGGAAAAIAAVELVKVAGGSASINGTAQAAGSDEQDLPTTHAYGHQPGVICGHTDHRRDDWLR